MNTVISYQTAAMEMTRRFKKLQIRYQVVNNLYILAPWNVNAFFADLVRDLHFFVACYFSRVRV